MKAPDSALDELYPKRADPPLPRALPLSSYVGTYHHEAYRDITIEQVEEQPGGGGDGGENASGSSGGLPGPDTGDPGVLAPVVCDKTSNGFRYPTSDEGPASEGSVVCS